MTWLTAKIGGYITAAGAFAVLLLGAFYKGRKSKAVEVQAETAKVVIKTTKKGKEIEKTNHDSGAKSRRDRLRQDASDN